MSATNSTSSFNYIIRTPLAAVIVVFRLASQEPLALGVLSCCKMSAYLATTIEEAKQLYDSDFTQHGNRVEWIDETTGLTCEAKRQVMGHWCGYVKVPDGKCDVDVDSIECFVHGGITFYDGKLVGFDCAHMGDFTPLWPFKGLRVWTLEAVKNECAKLARTIKEMCAARN